MSVTTPVLDFVRAYAKSGGARLHVPGHKGVGPTGAEAFDITEIAGADSLYEAEGIIAESEKNAAELFGTAATFYSTEGSSHCIRAMLKLALDRSESPGRPLVLAARNAHKSFLYAAALCDFDVQWMYPEGESSLCACEIAPEALRHALERCERKPFCVYITSPDYLGGLQDIPALASICHEREIPLLVDNAHGAYLRFLPASMHPMQLGADLCCDSAHKTLPVLTGGAYLHIARGMCQSAAEGAKQALSLFGSTSPSYLTLASLDAANRYLAEEGAEAVRACTEKMVRLKEILQRRGFAVAKSEPLKLTLLTDGPALAALLRDENIEPEYVDAEHVVMMFAPANGEEAFRRVAEALRTPIPCVSGRGLTVAPAPVRMTIRRAIFAAHEWVDIETAEGRVCAAPAVSCPPAIPIAVSGEEITPEAVRLFRQYGIHRVPVVRER